MAALFGIAPIIKYSQDPVPGGPLPRGIGYVAVGPWTPNPFFKFERGIYLQNNANFHFSPGFFPQIPRFFKHFLIAMDTHCGGATNPSVIFNCCRLSRSNLLKLQLKSV